jgi:hypothetical protein
MSSQLLLTMPALRPQTMLELARANNPESSTTVKVDLQRFVTEGLQVLLQRKDVAKHLVCVSTSLTNSPRPFRFVFEGLSPLMDDLLIRNARHIRLAKSSTTVKVDLQRFVTEGLQVLLQRKDVAKHLVLAEPWELFEQGPKVSPQNASRPCPRNFY